MDKQTLFAELESSHSEWLMFLETIPEESLTLPGVAGEWSVKDIVAHVAWYEWWLAEFITTRTWPKLPAHLNFENTDERNNAYFAHQRDVTLDATMANEQESHQALVDAVRGLTGAEYADQTQLGMPTGPGWSLPELIRASSIDHYREHTETIRNWLSRSSPS